MQRLKGLVTGVADEGMFNVQYGGTLVSSFISSSMTKANCWLSSSPQRTLMTVNPSQKLFKT
jgi:hypothetical protein